MTANTRIEVNKQLNLSEIKAGKIELKSKPIALGIDLTGLCNINPPCVFCVSKDEGYYYDPLKVDNLDDYMQFFGETENINDCSVGEPLSHPKFINLLKSVTENGQIFGFATNALLLNTKMANALVKCGDSIQMVVSVNAATKETYYKIKGKNIDKLKENLNYFIDLYRKNHKGKDPFIAFSMVVMKVNSSEVPNFILMAHNMGVKTVILRPLFKIPFLYNVRNDWGYKFVYEDEILSSEKLKVIAQQAKAVADDLGVNLSIQWESTDSEISRYSEEGVEIPCLMPWKMLIVRERSKKVMTCCFTSKPVGNLKYASIYEIWNGKTIKQIRQTLIRREIPDFCWKHGTNCPLVNEQKQKELASGNGINTLSVKALKSLVTVHVLNKSVSFLRKLKNSVTASERRK